jgi:putative membrane protein
MIHDSPKADSSYARLAAMLAGALCLVFMLIEMTMWVRIAPDLAGFSPEVAEATKGLGFNMGLYNGFLGAGLIYSGVGQHSVQTRQVLRVFLLGCLIVAGIGGAISLFNVKFLILQTAPGLAAMAVVLGKVKWLSD